MKKSGPPPFVIGAVRAVDRAIERAQRKMAPASVVMLQLVTERWRPQAIAVVARLGVADHLASGPLPASELARKTSTHEDALTRVMRALRLAEVIKTISPTTLFVAEPG